MPACALELLLFDVAGQTYATPALCVKRLVQVSEVATEGAQPIDLARLLTGKPLCGSDSATGIEVECPGGETRKFLASGVRGLVSAAPRSLHRAPPWILAISRPPMVQLFVELTGELVPVLPLDQLPTSLAVA